MLRAQLAREAFDHYPELARVLAVADAARFPTGKRVAEVS